MRLFTGISVPDFTSQLAGLREVAGVNWSPAENLHITVKFIGEWPEHRLKELQDALATMPRFGNIAIEVTRLGFFPNPHHPRILFAGAHPVDSLTELAKRTEAALEPLGYAREDRPYSPHITLARIATGDFHTLRERIAAMGNLDFLSFEATEFHLYQSKPGPGGSIYTKLASYPLA